MKPRSYIALVLITIAVDCSASGTTEELIQYIKENNTALFRTTIKKLVEKNQLNLENPCDTDNNTLLHLAVNIGSLSFVQALVQDINHTEAKKYFYLPNSKGWNPLQMAVHTYELDSLKYLIKAKGGIDRKRDRDLLDYAAIAGDLECIQYLVEECKLEVGKTDEDGGTPLHYAASKGNLSCMLYFIEKIKEELGAGAASLLNHRGGKYHNSPLHCLMTSNKLEDNQEKFGKVVEELKENKSLLNKQGKSPYDLGLNNLLIDIDLL